MTSSSSSTIVASPSANVSNYDVFLSFRGEDTRHTFADHLYDALNRQGICTFRDDDEIRRGEELKPEIEGAIKGSKTSIVVLSHNYATSTWCLDELLLILEQRRECGNFVLPVFYHVHASDVRNQRKSFEIEAKASSRWTDNNVKQWKKALREVADLAGMVLSESTPETEVVKKIVDTIYHQVCRKEVHIPINLTGLTTLDEEIISWLNGPNVEFLAICGMAGSGKTTLAKYIYNSNSKFFENVSFVEGIGRECEESNDFGKLQQQLLIDILGGKNRKTPGVSEGTCMIEEALKLKKALIVLDDIVEQDQLEALLGTGKINTQSKVIITTRVLNIEEWFDSRSWRCIKYKMELLNHHESLELFSRHAFRSKIPMEGFEALTLEAIRYCEGNPLALEVLGSSLSEDNSIPFWESSLRLLGRDIDDGIHRVLKRSYNSLRLDSIKQLFLHIACFFVGKDKDYVEKILEPDFSAISGIKILSNRCLLSVSPKNKLMMHRLLQEMGKHIVHQESKNFPAKRSRVWRSSESYKILSKGKGSETVEGLALDMELLRKENFSIKEEVYKIEKMSKSFFVDKTLEFTSSIFGKTMKSATSSGSSDPTIKESNEIRNLMDKSKAFIRDDVQEPASNPHEEKPQVSPPHYVSPKLKKVVLKLDIDEKTKKKAMKSISRLSGVESIRMDMKDKKMTVRGDVDPVTIVSKLRKICHTEIVSVGPAEEPEKKEKEKEKESEKKDDGGAA